MIEGNLLTIAMQRTSGTRGHLSIVLPVRSCGGVSVVARCQVVPEDPHFGCSADRSTHPDFINKERLKVSIQEIVVTRNIKELFHFTQVNNLATITTHGLIPRN